METKPFTPNHDNILQRKSIIPYGNVSLGSISTKDNTPISFKPVSAVTQTEASIGEYKFEAKIFEYTKTEHFTLKISNIPNDMSRGELERLVESQCHVAIINTSLPFNREINKNKGYAFITFQSKEKAKMVTKTMDNYQIGCQLLMVEDARKQF
ncbi:RNA recognition motif containing protein [Spraguea lophii 42_110]|uniref:RNA recognition motif containing protein n=1 Tax=Spraguea lophii (strain 42_110) TaxID=1358809 RepID=S7WDH4_SPRLO|nr:RNA recognition motif containing protein [Spraguea lophii 42_110]